MKGNMLLICLQWALRGLIMPLQDFPPQGGWGLRKVLPHARSSLAGSSLGQRSLTRQTPSGAQAGSAGPHGTASAQAFSHAG